MAEPTPTTPPAPVREPVADRATLLLQATWIRWILVSQQRLDARLATLEARLDALEAGP